MWLRGECVHVVAVGVCVSVGDVALIKVTFAFDTVIVLVMKEVK